MARSEKEKMLAGELYNSSDPELATALLRAQRLLARFNAMAPDAEEERRAVLTDLFGSLGEATTVKPTLRCDYGFNISIGRGAS
jgi:maltose O-acetyltransferase